MAKVQMNVTVDEEVRAACRACADEEERSLNWYVNHILKKHVLNKSGEEPPKKKAKPKASTEAKAPALSDLQVLCKSIWGSYKSAYWNRYGVEPIRNAKVNSQIKQIAQRLGQEAIFTAEFYIWINDAYLIRNCHPVDLLLKNCESYCTQAKKGQAITGEQARQAEKKQTNLNAAQAAIAMKAGRK